MGYLITNQNNFARVPYPCASYPNATVKSGGCGACSVLNCVENMTELRFKMADWIAYVIANGGRIAYVIANGGRIDGGTSIPAVLKALKRDYGFSYSATNDIAAVRGAHDAYMLGDTAKLQVPIKIKDPDELYEFSDS